MDKFRLNINGKEVTGLPGQTVLEVARENDIFIPTLCYDERTRIYGACGICMCEVEGIQTLSCSFQITWETADLLACWHVRLTPTARDMSAL